ncbi:unnamed protein product [Acanthoscelides obtectus]|uniref:Uncharacterized protein n=1 Tax=Acanthoscelides obtectus TaxID=200917 RepID=A0A9P0L2I2_ACAOB|nr:unnamed protein product [Acanthoscelides obtectus]CAK1638369.1 hypothetical protein AOBTE_LOCUS10569 [Acanthoscelides obtectus]
MLYVVGTCFARSSLLLKQPIRLLSTIKNQRNIPFLRRRTLEVTSRRSLFSLFRRPKKEELKIKDNVPDEYMLIYRNRMDRYLMYTQLITSASAAFIVIYTTIKVDYLTRGDTSQLPVVSTEAYFYMAAFVTAIVILQIMMYRTPLRIYYLPQQKKYTMIFYGSYPFSYRRVFCKGGEVVKLPVTGVSPWKECMYEIKNKQKIILLDDYFRRPGDLFVLMGEQEDPDADHNDDNNDI